MKSTVRDILMRFGFVEDGQFSCGTNLLEMAITEISEYIEDHNDYCLDCEELKSMCECTPDGQAHAERMKLSDNWL